MVFARRYDPLLIHVDRTLAAAGPFEGITAPGSLILAARQRLMNDFAFPGGVTYLSGSMKSLSCSLARRPELSS